MEQNMEEASIEHLVLLAHGIDGAPSDMHAVRDALMELHETGLETWETEVNQGSKTHDGVECCAERYWAALQVKLGEILILANKASETLRISMVGHSFGGLVLRSVASRLFATQPFGERMKLDTLVCIASPHLGCRLLGRGGAGGLAPLMTAFGLSIMRAGLRMIKGKTGPDLLLDNGALEALCNGTHAEALRAFERRIIYCNGTMDWLVNVESASLLTAEEMAIVLPLSLASCSGKDASVLWQPDRDFLDPTLPGNSDIWARLGYLGPTLRCRPTGEGGSSYYLELQPLARESTAAVWDASSQSLQRMTYTDRIWDPAQTAWAHTTWDDAMGWRIDGRAHPGRARQATEMLERIRAAGPWELHLCHFLDGRASFTGGVFSPHIDLVDLPSKGKSCQSAFESTARPCLALLAPPLRSL
jgi:hypothetical protein